LTVLLLLGVAAGTAHAGETDGSDLPPPRIIDRRSGRELTPYPTPRASAPERPAPAPRAEPLPTPAPATAPERPQPAMAPPAPYCGTPDPRWTTPPDAGRDGGTGDGFGDLRKEIPLIVGIQYSFAATRTNDEYTRGSDSLDITLLKPVADRVTVGVVGRWLVTHENAVSGGPVVNVRVLDETASMPTFQAGAYWLLGDGAEADRRLNLYFVGSKGFSFGPDTGPVRGLRLSAGVSYNWRTQKYFTNGWDGWFRSELELDRGFSVFAEAGTGCACDFSLTGGVTYASPLGINFTLSVFDCLGSYQGFRGYVDYADGSRRIGGKYGGGAGALAVSAGPNAAGSRATTQVRGQPATARVRNPEDEDQASPLSGDQLSEGGFDPGH